MKTLTRDEVLNVMDARIAKVEVPEWGGAVCVREMSGVDRDIYATWLQENFIAVEVQTAEQRTGMKMRLLSLSVCDEQGSLLFTPADMTALSKKSSEALLRVYKEALDINGMGIKAQEDIRKNSERVSDDNGSDSPGV